MKEDHPAVGSANTDGVIRYGMDRLLGRHIG